MRRGNVPLSPGLEEPFLQVDRRGRSEVVGEADPT